MSASPSHKRASCLVTLGISMDSPCLVIWRMLRQVSYPSVTVTASVSTFWDYHRVSSLGRQDKDFKRLNKGALASHATTAHVSLFNVRGNLRCRNNTCSDSPAIVESRTLP